MDNIGRAKWDNSPYNHTSLRQPNLNNLISGGVQDNSSESASSQLSRLSIDAPEFVPRFKVGPTSSAQPHLNSGMSPVMPLMDPAIIQHGNSYHPMAGQDHHNNLNHIQQPSHQHSHSGQHHQHQQHPHMHQQNTMAAVGGFNKPSVQSRLNLAGGGGSNRNNEFNNVSGDTEPTQQVSEKENRALNFLSDVINKLTDNPGMFEEIQRQLTTMFTDFSFNNFVMSNAVEMVFELSVDEQNFRYIGARLCRLLDSVDLRPNNIFRTLLCLKIDDHQSNLTQFIVSNEKRKVRGTTLFLAELYMQMQNDGGRISKIAESIASSMLLLLDNVGPENVKCVCQALKLCGYELEIDRPLDIQHIINGLQKIEGSLDVSTGRLLKSVLDLKLNRWGRTEAIEMAPILETVRHDYNDAPVFYGPDGQVLTDEENSFLLSNIPNYPNVNYEDFEDNDPDELVEAEPEMDLEIQMAFKDFVKSNKNKQL